MAALTASPAPVQAATGQHENHGHGNGRFVSALPSDLCLAIEQGYKTAHPERADLVVRDGTDCTGTTTMTVIPEAPPARATPGDPCSGFWPSTSLDAWGYIQVGYIQTAAGVCWDYQNVWWNWGPVCTIVFYPPNMNGWSR